MSGIHEECGIFGIYDYSGGHAAAAAFFGLVALQHRGQESCGIAVNNAREIEYYKNVGLVNDVFDTDKINALQGDIAVGHARYSTYGGGGVRNAQPLVLNYVKGTLAVAHNGNIINSDELKREYEKTGAIYQTTADSEIIAYTIAKQRLNTGSIEDAVAASMKILKGAYSLIVMSPQKLIAARDPWGFRPLCMGRTESGSVVFASESCALDAVGASFERDIMPGEVVAVKRPRITGAECPCSERPDIKVNRDNCRENSHLCIFEYIYFARPDSVIEGQFVQEARREAGRLLAAQMPVEADIVIGVPDSGLGAARGYSLASGILMEEGFMKNRYITRTFIRPTQQSREAAVRLKLNPIRPHVENKRVIMVDDSIVRGTTSKRIVRLLRNAGAKEVHVRISAPPFLNPCYFGTDIPSKKDLIAYSHNIDEIRDYIEADTLCFLSIENLYKIAPNARTGFCSGCFSGEYPVE
ncbi:MAG: amidophosphoribosyltransferase [Clostridiales bacterium]|jgi:amidophosphoribosyltransferase|nr:amidophosphoribosyltransferase [Clostridiales bacterium]